MIEILDAALAGAEQPAEPDKLDMHLPICTASLPLAATAQFVAAPLLPAAAILYAYTSMPTLKEARRVFVEEKRIGVDALDAVVMVGCLGTMSIFPGAVCCWCLSFGRFLVKKSRDSSQKLLLNAFGKQPKYAWLCRDGDRGPGAGREAREGRHHRRPHRRGRPGRWARGRRAWPWSISTP